MCDALLTYLQMTLAGRWSANCLRIATWCVSVVTAPPSTPCNNSCCTRIFHCVPKPEQPRRGTLQVISLLLTWVASAVYFYRSVFRAPAVVPRYGQSRVVDMMPKSVKSGTSFTNPVAAAALTMQSLTARFMTGANSSVPAILH